MKSFIILVLSIFLLISCGNSHSKNKKIDIFFNGNFPKETVVKLEALDQVNLLTATEIYVTDSILIITNRRGNPRFHFYNKTNLKKICSYGLIGEGPGEFLDPEICRQLINTPNYNQCLLLYEFGSGVIYTLSLDSILKEKNPILDKKFLPPELVPSLNFVKVGNNLIGQAVSSEEYRFYSLNFKNFKNYKQIGEIIDDDYFDGIPFADKRNLIISNLSYSESRKKFINAYSLLNKIEILDSNMNVLTNIFYDGRSLKFPKSRNFLNPNNKSYFLHPTYAGKNYFYVLYSGRTSKERIDSPSLLPVEIHKFDYDGNPIQKYIINGAFSSFTVDEKENVIYGTTFLEDKPVVKFKM